MVNLPLVRCQVSHGDLIFSEQEIDLRIGASFTRFQTILLSDSFVMPFGEEDKKLVLSYGPCQVKEPFMRIKFLRSVFGKREPI